MSSRGAARQRTAVGRGHELRRRVLATKAGSAICDSCASVQTWNGHSAPIKRPDALAPSQPPTTTRLSHPPHHTLSTPLQSSWESVLSLSLRIQRRPLTPPWSSLPSLASAPSSLSQFFSSEKRDEVYGTDPESHHK